MAGHLRAADGVRRPASETGVEGVYQTGDLADPPLGGDLSSTASGADQRQARSPPARSSPGAVTTPARRRGGHLRQDVAVVDSDINATAAIAVELATSPLARANHRHPDGGAMADIPPPPSAPLRREAVLDGTLAAAT